MANAVLSPLGPSFWMGKMGQVQSSPTTAEALGQASVQSWVLLWRLRGSLAGGEGSGAR